MTAIFFMRLGFRQVTISNLDSRIKGDEFAPYPWSLQDAENLRFEDGAFDFVVVHQGLHHCYSPHRGLLEMYRVARRGVLAFEPRDTRLVRLGVKLGFGQEYEIAAVAENGLQAGGVGNSATPNFIYRWTEREIEKTIRTFNPAGRAEFRYFSALRVPKKRIRSMKNGLWRGRLRLCCRWHSCLRRCFRSRVIVLRLRLRRCGSCIRGWWMRRR